LNPFPQHRQRPAIRVCFCVRGVNRNGNIRNRRPAIKHGLRGVRLILQRRSRKRNRLRVGRVRRLHRARHKPALDARHGFGGRCRDSRIRIDYATDAEVPAECQSRRRYDCKCKPLHGVSPGTSVFHTPPPVS
jgi:hypothetical protein